MVIVFMQMKWGCVDSGCVSRTLTTHPPTNHITTSTLISKANSTQKTIYHLPLSLASFWRSWISAGSSRNVCSKIRDKNLACVFEILFNRVYRAIVCSHSFQLENQFTKAPTWSLNCVCAGFISLEDKVYLKGKKTTRCNKIINELSGARVGTKHWVYIQIP